jgi:hypothetical protein
MLWKEPLRGHGPNAVELLHVWRAGFSGEKREAQFKEEIARVGVRKGG